ncbi:hypothetical protein [Bathymodiolus japonicus methanotrophic gill symbiont]|uniref:hypothetical protein n=1 Tax=Bathymodiolus japonicus methanotrophic gill symbiont TaxID=113269 RepID=UPI001C8E4FFF|nr:hypothetical protein [Bathymodiolus japonicus methanotrophic gill symbiont]
MISLTRTEIKEALKNHHVNKIYDGIGELKLSKQTIRNILHTESDSFSLNTVKILSDYTIREIERINESIGDK